MIGEMVSRGFDLLNSFIFLDVVADHNSHVVSLSTFLGWNNQVIIRFYCQEGLVLDLWRFAFGLFYIFEHFDWIIDLMLFYFSLNQFLYQGHGYHGIIEKDALDCSDYIK